MNAWDELVERCARRRRDKIGPLSDQAYDELVLAVRENPASFVDAPEEEAFLALAQALDAFRAAGADDDLLDDDAFEAAHDKRMDALAAACAAACARDPECLDAQVVGLLASGLGPDELIGRLLELERHAAEREGALATDAGAGTDAAAGTEGLWGNVFLRPRLRLRFAVAAACLDGAHFRMAESAASSLLDATPADPLGARHTLVLALARLEDEEGFDALDARFSRQGDAWSHLARVILLFKLNRMGAARRALRGYDELCQGGAYALLRPTFTEVYLPDRPEVAPCSFAEALLAVREAEPIIADVPDFVGWCQGHDWLVSSAERFAEKNDLDW